jgi:hypothetical protein
VAALGRARVVRVGLVTGGVYDGTREREHGRSAMSATSSGPSGHRRASTAAAVR